MNNGSGDNGNEDNQNQSQNQQQNPSGRPFYMVNQMYTITFGRRPDGNTGSEGGNESGTPQARHYTFQFGVPQMGSMGQTDGQGTNGDNNGQTTGETQGGTGPNIWNAGQGVAQGLFQFLNGFQSTKPRASERAIRSLKLVDYDSVPEPKSCSICFDPYTEPSKEEKDADPEVSVPAEGPEISAPAAESSQVSAHDDEEDDPEVSVPAEGSVGSCPMETDDPPESVPGDDTGEGGPIESDPPESVPEDSTNVPAESDPPESAPEEVTTNEEPDSSDPPESVPVDGENSSASPGGQRSQQGQTSSNNESQELPPPLPDDHRPVEMPCGHQFGLSCIKEWLKDSNSCPMCRSTIESHTDYLRSTGQQTSSHPLDFFTRLFSPTFRQAFGGDGQNSENRENNSNNNNSSNEPAEGDPPESFPEQNNQGDQGQRHTQFHRIPIGQTGFGVLIIDNPFGNNNSENASAATANTNPESNHAHTFVSRESMNTMLHSLNAATAMGTRQPTTFFFRPRTNDSERRDNDSTSDTPSGNSGRGADTSRASNNRESRHHPYERSQPRNPSQSELAPESQSQQQPSSESISWQNQPVPDQCGSLRLSLCVGENPTERLYRLGCGHAFHEPCLTMGMRAHGDIIDDNYLHNSPRDVWCTLCRRYQQLSEGSGA